MPLVPKRMGGYNFRSENESEMGDQAEKNENEKMERIRHSASHVMAEVVQSLFPEAKFGIGPVIENGLYYDFDLPRTLTPEDSPLI